MLMKNFTGTRVRTLSGKEEQIFKSFDLNLQLHIHNTTECKKYHSWVTIALCVPITGYQNQGRVNNNPVERLRNDMDCHDDRRTFLDMVILWNLSPFSFALGESKALSSPYGLNPGISCCSC